MSTYRLFPSTNGPSSPVSYSGNILAGVVFKVTQGGLWFSGYWKWVAAGGDTVSRKFALWAVSGAATGTLVPAATVASSGTLTAGQWNFIPLAAPVQLAIGGSYIAATGWAAAAGFEDSDTGGAGTGAGDSFGSGGHTSGIVQGPLTAFSDQGFSLADPFGNPQGVFSVAGTDPTVNMPSTGSNAGNFWMDVQVSDQAPSAYSGTFRLWPTPVGPSASIVADASDNYEVATEIALSQACTVSKVWYYSPAAATQLATAANIWNITGGGLTGTLAASNASPSWSGAAGSGWVSCAISATLPAGRYKAGVYNGAGTPAACMAKDSQTDYWRNGPGGSGITSGPISAPGLASASLAYNYNGNPAGTPPDSDGTTLAAQSTFTQGPPDVYPYLVALVATPTSGSTQNYWVDLEVTPVAVVVPPPVPPLPAPPGRMSPMAFRWQAPLLPPAPPGPVTVPAAAVLTGTGALAAAGTVSFTSAALLSGSGSVTAAETVALAAASVLSGSGTLAAAVSVQFPAACALSGSGALAAPALVRFANAAALSGSGALTLTALVTWPASAALSGSGSVAAPAVVQFTSSGALSGSGTLAAAGLVTQPAGAALSGTGSLAAAAAVRLASAAALSGAGSLTVTALATQPAGASLSGLGTLAAAGSVSGFTAGSAPLAGTGALTAAAAVQFAAAAPLAGTGALSAAGSVAQPASAALAGTGALSAAGAVSGFTAAGASLSGTGSIGVAVSVTLRQGAALSGAGALAAAARFAVPATAALSGTGSMAAAVITVVPASAALSGIGALAASPAVSGAPAAAALSGSGVLAAGPVLTLTASAALSGLGVLSVSVQVTSPLTEAPVAWSAQPAPPRWTAAPASPRWRVVMTLFSPIAAISLEEVNVTWMSSLAGTTVDPTGQTDGQPELPVQFAFPQTSGNYAEPAQPSAWYPATWLLGGTSIGYVAQALVGPGAGVVTLTSGQVFDVWSKVLGSPEAPARFVGQLPVY